MSYKAYLTRRARQRAKRFGPNPRATLSQVESEAKTEENRLTAQIVEQDKELGVSPEQKEVRARQAARELVQDGLDSLLP